MYTSMCLVCLLGQMLGSWRWWADDKWNPRIPFYLFIFWWEEMELLRYQGVVAWLISYFFKQIWRVVWLSNWPFKICLCQQKMDADVLFNLVFQMLWICIYISFFLFFHPSTSSWWCGVARLGCLRSSPSCEVFMC